ncbi:MAG: hypothetical protein QF745_02455, partial [Planctomycetota bacterium]|nr:hypothetical protein [Planctomycetota bacterium]
MERVSAEAEKLKRKCAMVDWTVSDRFEFGSGMGPLANARRPEHVPEQAGLSTGHSLIMVDSFNSCVNPNYTILRRSALELAYASYDRLFNTMEKSIAKRIFLMPIPDADFYGLWPNAKDGATWEEVHAKIFSMARKHDILVMPMEPLLVNLNFYRKDRYHSSSKNQDWGPARFWEIAFVRWRQLSELVNHDVEVGWLIDSCPYAEDYPWPDMDDTTEDLKPPVIAKIAKISTFRTIDWRPVDDVQMAEMIADCNVIFSLKASHQTTYYARKQECYVQSLTFNFLDVEMPGEIDPKAQGHFAPVIRINEPPRGMAVLLRASSQEMAATLGRYYVQAIEAGRICASKLTINSDH